MKILIIDDYKETLDVLGVIAKIYHHEVILRESFLNLEKDILQDVDVVICDMQVNGDGNSKDFLLWIKSINEKIVTVLMTGNRRPNETYYDLFYQKPFKFQDVLDRLKQFCKKIV